MVKFNDLIWIEVSWMLTLQFLVSKIFLLFVLFYIVCFTMKSKFLK